MHEIVFGQPEASHVRLRVSNVEEPLEPDYVHYRGVSMEAEFATGLFSGRSQPFAYFTDFERFERELSELERSLSGTASLAPQDNELEVTLAGDGIGHMKLSGFLADNAVHERGSVLRINLDLDQTYLPPILLSLRRFIAAYSRPALADRAPL